MQQQDSTIRPSVVTIGNFDGVHRGHQQILALAIRKAGALAARSVAFTFRPHPQSVLRPDKAPPLLLTYDEKRELLLAQGVDEVVEQPFAPQFAATTPEQFFESVILGQLSARAVVVGYDFTFGRERSGHLQVLEHLCSGAGVELTVVPPQRVEAEVVSSSVIRASLLAGRVAEAAVGLGRPFFYSGEVISGDRRGRVLGFPTANMAIARQPGGKLVLPFGVYATQMEMDGVQHAAVSNLGIRPTFVENADHGDSGGIALLETHLLDASPDLYGRQVRVSFVERIRGEQKFGSVSELQSQVSADIERARQILG